MSEQPKKTTSDEQRFHEAIASTVDLMRAHGIARLKLPWWVSDDYGNSGGVLELELGPEPPSPSLNSTAAAPAEAEEPPKRGPDGLTEEEAKLAYGHHGRR